LENPDLPWFQVLIPKDFSTDFKRTSWVFATVDIEDRGLFIETALILAVCLEK
jgi:hypothetical protein